MARKPRVLESGMCHHITVRCNNREFNLSSKTCRSLLIHAISREKKKYSFRLYSLRIMSNHVHYLMEPVAPERLPLIMKAINWYSAMCFNRLLNRTGHFWEARYHATSFPGSDHQRVLNVLRYIHANPKAAGLRQGYVYAYSNFGIYDRLTDDGLTQWQPAFLGLGATLDTCCNRYRRFCLILRPKRKSARRSAWGRRLLVGIPKQQRHRRDAGGQLSLFDDPERCQAPPACSPSPEPSPPRMEAEGR